MTGSPRSMSAHGLKRLSGAASNRSEMCGGWRVLVRMNPRTPPGAGVGNTLHATPALRIGKLWDNPDPATTRNKQDIARYNAYAAGSTAGWTYRDRKATWWMEGKIGGAGFRRERWLAAQEQKVTRDEAEAESRDGPVNGPRQWEGNHQGAARGCGPFEYPPRKGLEPPPSGSRGPGAATVGRSVVGGSKRDGSARMASPAVPAEPPTEAAAVIATAGARIG